MSVLDIILIIIGFVLVVISYYITEKVSVNNNNEDSSVTEVWGEKEEGTIKERVKNIVSDKSEQMIETVEDRLCHLSNDKIMEFKEYSDQVMESIKQEHKQAVFLYNMLNEKEESIKNLLNTLDIKYASVSDKLNTLNEKSEVFIEKSEPKKNTNNPKSNTITGKSEKSTDNKRVADKVFVNDETKKPVSKIENVVVETKKIKKEQIQNEKTITEQKAGPDRNDKILGLWKQGKTVLEISRQLGIGQGEVKLVIDLFKGDQL